MTDRNVKILFVVSFELFFSINHLFQDLDICQKVEWCHLFQVLQRRILSEYINRDLYFEV